MTITIHSDVLDYMDKYWKPNQDDSYIVAEKGCEIHEHLLDWFDNNSDYSLNVGPFVKVRPYSYFDVEENVNRTEFVFIYDDIDRSKLKSHHLTLI